MTILKDNTQINKWHVAVINQQIDAHKDVSTIQSTVTDKLLTGQQVEPAQSEWISSPWAGQ